MIRQHFYLVSRGNTRLCRWPNRANRSIIPPQFGRYRIVRKLGSGGMGSVYLAEDTQLERQVALKVPHFDPRTDADVLERFDREAKVTAKLTHPNTCQILDVGSIDGQRYLTMEFIDGPLLTELVDSKTLTDKQAIQLVRKIAAAVDEAHGLNIIHRDLKPANIMLTAHGDPKVMDFGLARRVGMNDQRMTQSGMIIGTPAYMSLEQLTGELDQVGPASDVYSLGVILYELLTGHLPFDVPDDAPVTALFAKILIAPPDVLTKYRPDIDPRLETVVLKAIAKQHSDRYRSMAELSAALTEYLKVANQPATSALTPTMPQKTDSTGERDPPAEARKKQRQQPDAESNGRVTDADDDRLADGVDWELKRFVTNRRKRRPRKTRNWRKWLKQSRVFLLWGSLSLIVLFVVVNFVGQVPNWISENWASGGGGQVQSGGEKPDGGSGIRKRPLPKLPVNPVPDSAGLNPNEIPDTPEWHCRLLCLKLRRATGHELGACGGARLGQPIVGSGSAFDRAGFDAIGTVTDSV